MNDPAADRPAGTRVLYVSPLKALAYDIDRNLRAPLAGVRSAAGRLGTAVRDVSVGMRTGDTPATERQRMVRHPPDILITTPESLFLLERGGRSLLSFGAPDEALAAAAAALADSVRGGRVGRLLVSRIDGGEPADQPLVAHLRAAGFADHPRGLVLRP